MTTATNMWGHDPASIDSAEFCQWCEKSTLTPGHFEGCTRGTTTRRSRRAYTAVIRDNSVNSVRVLRDGYGVDLATFYYRRLTSGSAYAYTGPAPIGSVHGEYFPATACAWFSTRAAVWSALPVMGR